MAFALPSEEDGFTKPLRDMGIEHDALLEAIGASNTERRVCSINSAKTAFGYYAYNGLVVGLTAQLRPLGYERVDLGGVLPLWVDHTRKIKIAISSGNAMTGVRVSKHQPKTRYPKGELTRQMVERNRISGLEPLFDMAMEVDHQEEMLAEYALWMMLVYLDKAKSEIRYELSRPVDISSKGIVKEFSPRIICPPYGVPESFPGDDPNEGFGDIDVPVEPR